MNASDGPTPATEKQPPRFEEALGQLAQIVSQLEDGQLSLADSLTRYEEGVGLLRACFQQLDQAERKIELLSGVDAAGRPVAAPLDDKALSAEEKAAARSQRRTATKSRRSRQVVDDSDMLF